MKFTNKNLSAAQLNEYSTRAFLAFVIFVGSYLIRSKRRDHVT